MKYGCILWDRKISDLLKQHSLAIDSIQLNQDWGLKNGKAIIRKVVYVVRVNEKGVKSDSPHARVTGKSYEQIYKKMKHNLDMVGVLPWERKY